MRADVTVMLFIRHHHTSQRRLPPRSVPHLCDRHWYLPQCRSRSCRGVGHYLGGHACDRYVCIILKSAAVLNNIARGALTTVTGLTFPFVIMWMAPEFSEIWSLRL